MVSDVNMHPYNAEVWLDLFYEARYNSLRVVHVHTNGTTLEQSAEVERCELTLA